MKFIISSSRLLKKLQLLGGVLGNNNSMRILDNFLLEFQENKLKVSATDLETSINTIIEVESSSQGQIAVDGKMLLEILKQFPEQPLTFLIKENNILEISSSKGNYTIAYVDTEDFPKAISLPDTKTTELPGTALSAAISRTLFATGNDDMRPALTGILFKFSPNKATFVATDASKIAIYERTDFKGQIEGQFIMPKKSLSLLKNLFAEVEENLSIEFNDNNAKFSYGGIELTCRLIDAKYPEYEKVIPIENPNVMTISRDELFSSIRRMVLFSNKVDHQVRLDLAGASLKVSASDKDYNNQAEERLNCQYQGDDMVIGFNSRFLSEMLGSLTSEEVTLEMSLPQRGAILKPSDSDQENENILMVVMPTTINH